MKTKRTFKESIRRLFLLYTFLPVLTLFVLFFLFTVLNTKWMLINKTNEANERISRTFLDVYHGYYDEINRMAGSPAVLELALTRLNSHNVYEQFYEFNNRQQVKSVFHFIDTKGVLMASTSASNTDVDDFLIQSIIPRIEKDPTATLTETNYTRYPHDRFTVYTFGKAVIDQGNVVGYLIYQLYEEDVQKLIFVQNNEIAVITDRHHTIIATTNNITKGLLNKFNPSFDTAGGYLELGSGKYVISQTALPAEGLHVYTLNSTEQQQYVYISLSVFILATSLLLWYLIRFLAVKMSAQNTRSIDKLLYAIDQLEQGNLLSYVRIKTGDEFETLAERYNMMLKQLNNLLLRNNELSDLRRKIEVKQLQSQFHPHFIFNVLETLRYAIVVDRDQAMNIVMTLSRLLRYSINNDEPNVSLQDDLDYLRDYLNLQQIRFNHRLRYEIDVSEEARDALVPRLMLQAAVENSIKYGYTDRESLFISIRGCIAEGNLVMEVEDDGYGMSAERLEQVRRLLSHTDNESNHIGLYNTHRRLVLLYGEDYGLHIDSVYGEGTRLQVTIPYRPYEESR